MPHIAAMYNSQRTLEEADQAFTDRDAVFTKLAPLFIQYGLQYGVSMLHAHCFLAAEEVMVADGNVCSPSTEGVAFPCSWLANGDPFEFRRDAVPAPPTELLTAFAEAIGPKNADILGLVYTGDMEPGKVLLERTEGRNNITEVVDPDIGVGNLQTAWLPGAGENGMVRTACVSYCETRQSGVNWVHGHPGQPKHC
ncbi:hypothetical protein GGX14DRAFT_351892 [Mycena pura]|uniref:Uncharacterized protein n=1 Tax=Mycena pura TaxID=153505 RepID=A0AAD6YLY6_9AGAR|nr:hypothetical protein GGX14DRAFT_351892 [Mycena pura]